MCPGSRSRRIGLPTPYSRRDGHVNQHPGLDGGQAIQTARPSLMDNYEYVMYGKIFKYKDAVGGGQVRLWEWRAIQ